MKRTMRAAALPSALLTGVLSLTGCAGETDPTSTSPTARATDTTSDDGQEASAHNEADVTFATGMIPHHVQAVEMADMALSRDGSRLTELAEQIKAAQGPETEQLSEWLTAWGEAVPPTDGGHDMGSMDHSMAGMMTEEDMQRLMDAEATEFEVLWLEMMIEHHEGAVDMAQTEVDEGEHDGAQQMAQDVVRSQSAEIEEMSRLLAAYTGR